MQAIRHDRRGGLRPIVVGLAAGFVLAAGGALPGSSPGSSLGIGTGMAQAQAQAQSAEDAAAEDAAVAEDPVVGRVGDAEIRRSDLLATQGRLPAEYREIPFPVLFRGLLDYAIDMRLIQADAAAMGLAEDPEVERLIALYRNEVMRQVYEERLREEAVSEEALRERYTAFLADAPSPDEVQASHILVTSEEEANALIAELEAGADFDELARERSIEPGAAQSAGDLGYFTYTRMVPEFAEAAFAMAPGEISDAPVESQFGWHVIKVVDRREGSHPSFEQARPQLEQLVGTEAMEARLDALRDETPIERFQIDGTPLPPAE